MKGKRIPNYALYGESALPLWHDLLHVEWVHARSAIYRGEIEPHRHDALVQILYVRSGAGELNIEHRRLAFAAPCIILLPCGMVHSLSHSMDTDGLVISAAHRPLESMARIASAELPALLLRPALIPLPWPADGQEPLWPLLQLLEQEANGEAPGHTAAGLALLVTLLVHIARLAQPGSLPRTGTGRRAALLAQFRELINQQFRQHWSLELYAGRLGISTAQLGRICREEVGESAMDLVNARVMREAQRQLAYSELEVKQIAHDLGFRDTSYFSRYFRKQAGIQPGEFRDAFRRAEPVARPG